MIIIGAGNLGKHVIDQLEQDDYQRELIFFDENFSKKTIYNKYQVISKWEELFKYLREIDKEYFIAIGNPRIRKKIHLKISEGKYTSILSKHVGIISKYSTIGEGTLIQPACCISHNVTIGISSLIHASTLIGHNVNISNYVTIGSNVNILKNVKIGEFTTISPNTLIYPDVKIGNNVYIGPGVIVKNDIRDYETIIR
ncbi:MAG TPA: acetyltransferase [Bacteroidales bacterium]|nr:acetyltransferase [Bacteroidales bacterium]HRT00730.1 acetyltransferase [Bacteroidales bacterium]